MLYADRRLERLNRDIQDACSNLFKHTPDESKSMARPQRSIQQSNTSPEILQLKSRRATTAFPERKDKKVMKTYRTKASQDTEFHSSSDLALGYTPVKKLQFIDETRLSQENTAHMIATKVDLKVLKNNDLREHEAASCRNHDLHDVQQHLESVEKVGPAQSFQSPTPLSLPKSAGCGRTQHSESSTMPLSTEEQKMMLAKCTSVITSDHLETKSSTDHMPSPTLSSRSLSDNNNLLSLDVNRTQLKKRRFSQIDLPNTALENENKLVRVEEPSAPVISGGELIDQEANDELSLSVVIPMPGIIKSKPPKYKKIKADERASNDELGSDEISSGLPVEHYQPRPSRSRSGLVDDKLLVPVDFSKRPEIVVKSKRKKRRKTTAFEQLIYDEDNEEEVTEIAQSFREEKVPQEPTAQLMKPNHVVTISDDPHTEPFEPDLVAKASSPKKRGRPKKQVTEVPNKPPMEHNLKPCEPKNSKPAIPNKIPNRNSEAEDLPNPLFTTESDAENSAPDDFPILSEKQPNAAFSPPPSNPNLSSNLSSPTKIQIPPQTPQKSSSTTTTTTTAKGPDKHSPLNSGKVAYRVGLSKRARIEPLLRMVRK